VRVTRAICLVMLCLALTLPMYGRSRVAYWTTNVNGVQDVDYGEGGVDCGGILPWCDDDELNLTPVIIGGGSLSIGGVPCVREKGALNGAIYDVYVPTVGFNNRCVMGLHPTGTDADAWHNWPLSWSAWYPTAAWLVTCIQNGYAYASTDGGAGGHPTHLMLQRCYELKEYMKVTYDVTDGTIWMGGSFGALVSPYAAFLWSDTLAVIGGNPIGFDTAADVRWSKLLFLEKLVSRVFPDYNWLYDPMDVISTHELSEMLFENSGLESVSMADRAHDMNAPIYIRSSDEDLRQNPDLYLQDIDLPADRFLHEYQEFSSHSWGGVEWTTPVSAAILSDTEDMIDAWANRPYNPGVERETPDSTIFSDILDDLPSNEASGPHPTYMTETWKQGHGIKGGLFGSMYVGDVDSDSRIEVVLGSVGGSIHVLQQSTDGGTDWELEHQAIGGQLGWGTFAIDYSETTGYVYAGTQTGHVYCIDPDAGTLLGGPSPRYDIDIQHMQVTDDLNTNGTEEVWFRSYSPTDGAYIWCVEYNPVKDEWTTVLQHWHDWHCSDFIVGDTGRDGEDDITISSARGYIERWPLQTHPIEIGDTYELRSSSQPYGFIALEYVETGYMYALTLPTYFTDPADPWEPQSDMKAMVFMFEPTTLTSLDYAYAGESMMFSRVSSSGEFVLTSDPENTRALMIRQVDSINNDFETNLSGLMSWHSTSLALLDCTAIDIAGSAYPEVVAVDEGGNVHTIQYNWANHADPSPPSPILLGSGAASTENHSRVFAMAMASGPVLKAAKGYGYTYDIDPADGSISSFGNWRGGIVGMVYDASGPSYTFHTGAVILEDFGYGKETIYAYRTGTGASDRGCAWEDSGWNSAQVSSVDADSYANASLHTDDFDDDGDADLLVGSISGKIYCFDKSSDSGTNEAIDWTVDADLGWGFMPMDSADMYGTSHPEVVVGCRVDEDEKGRVYILEWNGSKLELNEDKTAYLPAMVYGVQVYDIDGDGEYEIIVGDGAGYLHIYDENLQEIWTSPCYGLMAGAFDGLLVTDAAGDGTVEIYMGSSDYLVRLDYAGE